MIILEQIEKLADMGQSTTDKHKEITAGEVHHVRDLLVLFEYGKFKGRTVEPPACRV